MKELQYNSLITLHGGPMLLGVSATDRTSADAPAKTSRPYESTVFDRARPSADHPDPFLKPLNRWASGPEKQGFAPGVSRPGAAPPAFRKRRFWRGRSAAVTGPVLSSKPGLPKPTRSALALSCLRVERPAATSCTSTGRRGGGCPRISPTSISSRFVWPALLSASAAHRFANGNVSGGGRR